MLNPNTISSQQKALQHQTYKTIKEVQEQSLVDQQLQQMMTLLTSFMLGKELLYLIYLE
jgi:hypothetical protein